MLSRDKARELVLKILSRSRADEAEVVLSGGTVTHLRFARNSPSTSGSQSGPRLTVKSSFGKKTGAFTVNQLDDETLDHVVRRSEEMARLAPDDPEFMPGLGSREYAEVPAYYESTATQGPARMAVGVAECIDAARDKGFMAAGFARTQVQYEARGNSRGNFAHHRSTAASFSVTARTPDGSGSGWAGQVARRIDDIDYAGAAAIAVEKAATSQKPRELKPGKYVTVLEPSCVASILQSLLSGMDRRRADEGRSYFAAPAAGVGVAQHQPANGAGKRAGGSTRLGENLFGAEVDIRSDPKDERCPSRPWDEDGVPQTARAWIDHGRVANLVCDRYWAMHKNTDPVPRPANLLMAGGTETLADLIRATRRGVLVTSFWYIRFLDPQTLLFTGLTRDGVFWIENGEIAYPVNNFRWNESPVSVLKKIEAMSAAGLAAPRGGDELVTVAPYTAVPALRVSEFNFASVSDAV